jgi:hypothetical protein
MNDLLDARIASVFVKAAQNLEKALNVRPVKNRHAHF